MGDYLKEPRLAFPRTSVAKSQENRFWETFKRHFDKNHPGVIADLVFSPSDPHDLLVANSIRVTAHSAVKHTNEKTLCTMKDPVTTARFRPDGALVLVAGGKVIRVVSPGQLKLHREYKGPHQNNVHVVAWHPTQLDSFVSTGDDKRIVSWDLISSKAVKTINEAHGDFIRAGVWHGSLFATGSYDKTVALWDMRTANAEKARQFKVPDSVESMFSVNDDVLAIASGSALVFYSLRADGVIKTLKNHRKTILTVTGTAEGGRVMSGGIDGLIKVFDTRTYTCTHSFEMDEPVSALAISPNTTDLAVGFTTGKAVVLRRSGAKVLPKAKAGSAFAKFIEAQAKRKETIKRGTSKWFTRGGSAGPQASDLAVRGRPNSRYKKLKPWDDCLKKFRFQEALTAAFNSNNATVVSSVIEALWKRDGLKISLSNRTTEETEQLLQYVIRYIKNPHVTHLYIQVGVLLLEIYGERAGHSTRIYELFQELRQTITEEVDMQQQLIGLY